MRRASGLLLHPTSLPSRYSVGNMGASAREFAKQLQLAGQKWWQMLPIGPTGMGDSPYNALSAFAGNSLLISPDDMVTDGYLSKKDLASLPHVHTDHVDFTESRRFITGCLRLAFEHFHPTSSFERFCQKEKEWLEPYALFISLKSHNVERSWIEWAKKKPSDTFFKDEVRFHKFVQFIFSEQWERLRADCAKRGIGLIGDVPIYVAHDSADVWANPSLFYLQKDGRPSFVAGTPPDYFSKSGQWWGNPLYRWEAHKKTGYRWWRARLRRMFDLFDVVRLDHFIGFERYWKIEAQEDTAKNGRWAKGPGEDFFKKVLKKDELARIIAEDLGATGPDVERLRDKFNFPGMKVLHFSFRAKGLAPIQKHSVVYTGTHDNDTTRSWFENLPTTEQKRVLRVTEGSKKSIHWDMIRTALGQKAELAVFPVQDVLGLGAEARMNTPGSNSGNWQWRMKEGEFKRAHASKLRKWSHHSGRH